MTITKTAVRVHRKAMSEALSWPRTVVVCVVLILSTFLAYTNDLEPATVAVIFTSVAGYAMGYINGKKHTEQEDLREGPPK